ncbi:MAG: hypothetical protein L6420_05800 [Elusimicrobia bacterium]|nr:hypothetical protein [Elusimicrobiota bacterium]
MKLEIRNINVSSILFSSVPVVVFVLGLLGAVITFFFTPSPAIYTMTVFKKFIAIGMYSLMYTLLVVALLVFVVFIYNFFTNIVGLRGIKFDIEEINQE